MWSPKAGWRDEIWSRLDQPWDLVIVGGGITGAGILAEAARMGKKALLVEVRDFSSGTSSRSTKLVHGGLRYLRQGQVKVTRESVIERERLLREAKGLVTPLGFFVPNFTSDSMPGWMVGAGLATIALFGVGIGIGNVFSTLISTVGRNPSVQQRVFPFAIIGFALVEAVGLFALLIAFLILFT